MTEQPARDDSAHDDDRQQKQQDTPSPLKNPRVRWTLAIIGLLVAVALVAWLVYHLLVGRYLQDTNNAYLQASRCCASTRAPTVPPWTRPKQ